MTNQLRFKVEGKISLKLQPRLAPCVYFSSREWSYVDAADKRRLMQNSQDDGEFW